MNRFRSYIFGFVALLIVPQPVSAQRLPVIDMHMHAGEPYVPSGELSPCFPASFCDPRAGAARTGDNLLRSTLQAMDRQNIVLVFLSDSRSSVDAWFAEAPDRFMRSVLISDPARADLNMLRSGYQTGELRGMGELATQYEGFAANDPRLDPLFALAEEYDVPVLIHSAGTGGPVISFESQMDIRSFCKTSF